MRQGKTARRYIKFSSGYLSLLGLDMGLIFQHFFFQASLVVQTVKNLPAMQEMQV